MIQIVQDRLYVHNKKFKDFSAENSGKIPVRVRIGVRNLPVRVKSPGASSSRFMGWCALGNQN